MGGSVVSSSNETDSNAKTISAVAGALSGAVARFVVGVYYIKYSVSLLQFKLISLSPTSVIKSYRPYPFGHSCAGPLDVVKIRFQVQLEPVQGSGQAVGKYRGILQCMREIVKEEGVAGLWRGTVPGQLLTIPYCAVQVGRLSLSVLLSESPETDKRIPITCPTTSHLSLFSPHSPLTRHPLPHPQFLTIHHLKDTARKLGITNGDLAPLVSFGSGAVAGVAATIASYPFDVLRTTLAAQGEPKVYKGMVEAAQGILQREGVRGLFKGITPTMVEIIPYAAIQFGLYDSFNAAFNQARKRVGNPLDKERGTADTRGAAFLQQFTCGFFSGLFSKLATHPLDVIKKRFQVAGLPRDLRYGRRIDSRTVQRNFLQVLGDVYRSEGLRGLYKGALPSIIKAAPNAAVTFVTYEFFVGYLSASEVFRPQGSGRRREPDV